MRNSAKTLRLLAPKDLAEFVTGPEGEHLAVGIWHRRGRGVRMWASNPLCIGGQPMVALNEQFRHSSTTARGRRSQVTGYGLQGESGVNTIDQRSRITDQKRRTSNDLFIDHYSLVIERSACANETIFCGYPGGGYVEVSFLLYATRPAVIRLHW